MNVTIRDNGSAYMISVDGLIVAHKSSLGEAWRHVVWMHRIATQEFTVGLKCVPVKVWIDAMLKAGYLE